MTTERLWTRYQRKRTSENRNDLVMRYFPLANLHAIRVQYKIQDFSLFNDLLGAASLGLIQAVEAFDPKRKLKFSTFAAHRIRGAIMDWLRSMDLQSRTVRIFEKKKHAVEESLAHDEIYGETTVIEKMGISHERYSQMNGLLIHGKQVQLNSFTDCPESNHSWDTVDKKSPDPTRTINRSFLREFIIKGLERVDRMILVLYYCEGLTLREIGNIMDLSESRTSQIKKNALACLRWNLKGTIYEQQRLLLA